MAIVEIWDQFGLTGHASMWINDDDNCSFHPIDKNLIKDVAGTKGIFLARQDDIKEHKRPISQTKLNFLQDDLMTAQLDKWDAAAQQNKFRYSLLGNNCSRTVAHLICVGAGLHWDFFKHIDQLAAQISRMPGHHNSLRATELIQDTIEDYEILASRNRILSKSKILSALLTFDVLTRVFAWTPGDVQKFAKLLEPHNHPEP